MSEKITTCDCGDPAYGGNKQCSFCSSMEGILAPPPAPYLPDVPHSGLEQRFFQGLNTITRRAVLQVLGGHSDAFMEQVRNRGDERRLFKHLFKAAPEPAARLSLHMKLRQIIQDYLVNEDQFNSVEFDAVFSRYTEEELADKILEYMEIAAPAQDDAKAPAPAAAGKAPFTKGDTFPSGDCGYYESGIHNMAGNHYQAIVCYGTTAEKAEATRDQVLDALLAPSTGYAKFGYILEAADGHQTWLKGDPAAGMGRYGKIIQLYQKVNPTPAGEKE